MGTFKKVANKAQRFWETHKKGFEKELKEAMRYGESFSKASEEMFGLPKPQRKKKD